MKNLFSSTLIRSTATLLVLGSMLTPLAIYAISPADLAAIDAIKSTASAADLASTASDTSLRVGATFAGLPVNDAGQKLLDGLKAVKKSGLDKLMLILKNLVVHNITSSIVNWINTGFQGSPAFIQDPEGFFKDTADQVSGVYIHALGAENALCSPFSLQIRVALKRNASRDTETRYQCTLSKVVANMDAFLTDFKQGGWAGWFQLAQEENSPYSRYLIEQEKMQARAAEAIAMKDKEITNGRGFLSQRDQNGFIVTPGATIENQLNNTLDSDLRRLEMADEFDRILSALQSQLVIQVVEGAKGLFGASKTQPGSTSYLDQVAAADLAQQANARAALVNVIQTSLTNEQSYFDARSGTLQILRDTRTDLAAFESCLVGSNPTGQANTSTQANSPTVVTQNLNETRSALTKIDAAILLISTDLANSTLAIADLRQFSSTASSFSGGSNILSLSVQFQAKEATYHKDVDVFAAQDERSRVSIGLATVSNDARAKLTSCRTGTLQ